MIIFDNIDYSWLRRGYKEIDYGDSPIAWPRCKITGCDVGVCIDMSKSLCYPHGIEFGAFTEEQFEADRKRKFKND